MTSQQNSTKKFNYLTYGKNLKKVGVNPEVADVHVEAAEGIIHDIIHHSGLVTQTEFNEKFVQIDQKIELLRKDMDHQFARIEQKFDQKFEQVDQKFELVNQKMEAGFTFLKQDITLQISKITNKMLMYIGALSISLIGTLITKVFHFF